jgi:hypothetical protein
MCVENIWIRLDPQVSPFPDELVKANASEATCAVVWPGRVILRGCLLMPPAKAGVL